MKAVLVIMMVGLVVAREEGKPRALLFVMQLNSAWNHAEGASQGGRFSSTTIVDGGIPLFRYEPGDRIEPADAGLFGLYKQHYIRSEEIIVAGLLISAASGSSSSRAGKLS